MRAVELVHEDLCERLTTSLPTFLRTNVRPHLIYMEQGRFHDFIKDFTPNTLFHLISLAPLPGHMVLTMSHNVSYLILEQRLGGQDRRPLCGTRIDRNRSIAVAWACRTYARRYQGRMDQGCFP